MDWYYGVDEQQLGPVSEQDLRAKITSGEIDPDALVWKEGMDDWLQVRQVPEMLSAATGDIGSSVARPASGPASSGGASASRYLNNPASVTLGGGSTGNTTYGPTQKTSGLAIAALCLGIGGLMLCQILSFGGVICGHMALRQIKESNFEVGGKGMALAGLITGYLGIVLLIGIIIFYGVMLSIPEFREALLNA